MRFCCSTYLRRIPKWVVILLLVGVIPRWIVNRAAVPVLWPDSLTYLSSARLMAVEGNYWMHEIYRTPMYPLFLSLFLGGGDEPAQIGARILLTQQIFGIAAGLLFFLTLRRAFSERVALWGAALFLVSPLQLVYEVTILTEAQFILFLALFLWLAGRMIEDVARKQMSFSLCLTLGLSAAVLSLSRPIGQLLLPAVLSFCALRYGITRKMVCGGLVSLIAFVIGVFPWMKVNHDHYGFWGISRDFGLNMFHRVLDVDETPLPDQSGDTFIRESYLKAEPKPGSAYFYVYFDLLRHLRKSGTPRELVKLTADKRMGDFALEVLRANPARFVPNTVGYFWRLFVNPRPSLHLCDGGETGPYVCSNHPGIVSTQIATDPQRRSIGAKKRAAALLTFARVPDGIFALFAFVGALLSFRAEQRDQVLFLLFTVLYFTGLAAIFNCPEDRFRLPVDCLIFALAAFGVGKLVQRARHRRAC